MAQQNSERLAKLLQKSKLSSSESAKIDKQEPLPSDIEPKIGELTIDNNPDDVIHKNLEELDKVYIDIMGNATTELKRIREAGRKLNECDLDPDLLDAAKERLVKKRKHLDDYTKRLKSGLSEVKNGQSPYVTTSKLVPADSLENPDPDKLAAAKVVSSALVLFYAAFYGSVNKHHIDDLSEYFESNKEWISAYRNSTWPTIPKLMVNAEYVLDRLQNYTKSHPDWLDVTARFAKSLKQTNPKP